MRFSERKVLVRFYFQMKLKSEFFFFFFPPPPSLLLFPFLVPKVSQHLVLLAFLDSCCYFLVVSLLLYTPFPIPLFLIFQSNELHNKAKSTSCILAQESAPGMIPGSPGKSEFLLSLSLCVCE